MRTTLANLPRAAQLILAAALGACAGPHFEGNVYRDGQVTFQVGQAGSAWQPLHLGQGDVALRHTAGGTILANAACDGVKDAPLEVLANQALFGVTDVEEWDRKVVSLDGRAALRLRLSAKVDGVPVDLDLVVLKKDGCVYDLQLISGDTVFVDRDRDFDRFVDGFRALSRSS